jgi:hypothetical protein
MGTICVLNQNGHSQVEWKDEETIKSAQELFEKLVKNGWRGVQTFPGTDKLGQTLKEFDPTAEHIVMIPVLIGG